MPDAGHLPPCQPRLSVPAVRPLCLPSLSVCSVPRSYNSLPPPSCAIRLTHFTISTTVIIGVYNCSYMSRGGALVKASQDRGRARSAEW